MNKFLKSALFPILILLLLVFVAQRLVVSSSSGPAPPNFPELIQMIDNHQIKSASINLPDQTFSVTTTAGKSYSSGYPDNDVQLTSALTKSGTGYTVTGRGTNPWWGFLETLLPFVLFIVFWIYLMNRMQGGGSKVMSFGKSRAKRMSADAPKVTFRDVAGADEAVEELHEIRGVPREPREVPGAGCAYPQGRAAVRSARHR